MTARAKGRGLALVPQEQVPVPLAGTSSKNFLHLGEPLEPPPLSPARGPPTDSGELLQIHFRSRHLPGDCYSL